MVSRHGGDQSKSPCAVEKPSFPSWKTIANLFNEVLHVHFLQGASVKLQTKVAAREGIAGTWECFKYMIQINVFTVNWVD